MALELDLETFLSAPVRYVLLQIPETLLFGGALYYAVQWDWISSLLAWVAFVLWVAKDVALYPLVRRAYVSEPSDWVGAGSVVGRRGVVEQELAPSGYVRVAGERWRAEVLRGGREIPPGAQVRVEEVNGLTLMVSPLDSGPAGTER